MFCCRAWWTPKFFAVRAIPKRCWIGFVSLVPSVSQLNWEKKESFSRTKKVGRTSLAFRFQKSIRWAPATLSAPESFPGYSIRSLLRIRLGEERPWALFVLVHGAIMRDCRREVSLIVFWPERPPRGAKQNISPKTQERRETHAKTQRSFFS